MSEELKPCPFCGGIPTLRGGTDGADIHCMGCDSAGPYWGSREIAIAAWNRRPTETPASGEREGEEWKVETCRNRLRDAGMPYARSSCAECGSLLRPGWKCPHEAAAPSPAPAGESDSGLVERLKATRKGEPFGWACSDGRSEITTPEYFVNPDGPEAADRIEQQAAEIRRLTEALAVELEGEDCGCPPLRCFNEPNCRKNRRPTETPSAVDLNKIMFDAYYAKDPTETPASGEREGPYGTVKVIAVHDRRLSDEELKDASVPSPAPAGASTQGLVERLESGEWEHAVLHGPNQTWFAQNATADARAAAAEIRRLAETLVVERALKRLAVQDADEYQTRAEQAERERDEWRAKAIKADENDKISRVWLSASEARVKELQHAAMNACAAMRGVVAIEKKNEFAVVRHALASLLRALKGDPRAALKGE